MMPLSSVLLALAAACSSVGGTDRPIIGVLTVPADQHCGTFGTAAEPGPQGGVSCFHSMYVKWIESAGGRVVPLLYNAPAASLEALFDSVNGVLFTGGGTNITDLDSQYMRSASLLLKRALAANSAGVHMPLWGTCMGFQTLSVLLSEDASVLKTNQFDSEALMLPLDLATPAMASESRLLRSLPPEVVGWLTTENVTVNYHHDGVSPDAFISNEKLSEFARVISTNRDRKGQPFVSTFEGRAAPVYAVQWHPERPQFEFKELGSDLVAHSSHTVRAMQEVANFFVDEARLNDRGFSSSREEADQLIYNYHSIGRSSTQFYSFVPQGSDASESIIV